MIMEETKIRSKNMWIANWFMSCHVTNSMVGMYNVQEVTESIMLNDRNEVYAMKCGKLRTTVTMQEGKTTMIILDEVQYVPGFYRKLFSLMTAMRRGARISRLFQVKV